MTESRSAEEWAALASDACNHTDIEGVCEACLIPALRAYTAQECDTLRADKLLVELKFSEASQMITALRAALTEAQKPCPPEHRPPPTGFHDWHDKSQYEWDRAELLQQRVEALEKASISVLAFMKAMRGEQHHTVVALEAALRRGETG